MDTSQGCPEGKLKCDLGELAITNGASLSRSLFGIEYILFPMIKENSLFLLSYRREGNCLLVLWSTYFFLSQPHFWISFQTYSYHRSNHKTLTMWMYQKHISFNSADLFLHFTVLSSLVEKSQFQSYPPEVNFSADTYLNQTRTVPN